MDQLVSSLRSGALRQCVLVEESSRLLQRCSDLQSSMLHSSTVKQGSPQESETKSTPSPAGEHGHVVDPSLGIQSSAGQRLHRDQVRNILFLYQCGRKYD